MLCSASRVGAYALMRVAKRFFAKGMRHVISLSLMPIGDSGMRYSSLDFTAKPTPWLRREPSGTPFQKKVYPAPASVRESSPCSLVSLRAAMSMLYRTSSRATRAVLRWGLSGVSARSNNVRTFHEAILNLFFTLVFRPRGGDAPTVAAYRPEYGEQTIFRPPFPGPSPSQGWAVWGCSVAVEAAEKTRCSIPQS